MTKKYLCVISLDTASLLAKIRALHTYADCYLQNVSSNGSQVKLVYQFTKSGEQLLTRASDLENLFLITHCTSSRLYCYSANKPQTTVRSLSPKMKVAHQVIFFQNVFAEFNVHTIAILLSYRYPDHKREFVCNKPGSQTTLV